MSRNATLYELNSWVRDAIEGTLDEEYWVEAELANVREVNGHCYMELVEKDEQNHTPVAQASAKCWRQTWMLLRPHFERVTGKRLQAGMKVLLQVRASFHEAYGFAWIVTDINPEFTMGDMARRRQEIIAKLKAEGIYDMQKQLDLPLFCQRIAVVSSAGAAGYGDFCHQLEHNAQGLRFFTKLFPATMQGEQVEESIIMALNAIAEHEDDYDVVVIIRGGGATADLSGFDTLLLSENVCNFPLPIITGIGHERDESILDLISYHSVKTPTAAAAFLIDRLTEVKMFIDDASETIVKSVTARMKVEKMRVEALSTRLTSAAVVTIERKHQQLERMGGRLSPIITLYLQQQRQRLARLTSLLGPMTKVLMERRRGKLDQLAVQVKVADPQVLLSRGYSITTHEGRVVRDASLLKSGDVIETRVEKGSVESVVK